MTKTKKRILLTIPNFDTAGSGKVVYDLAKYLNPEIFEVEIACSHNKGKFFEEIKQLGVKIHLLETTSQYRPVIRLIYRIWRVRNFFKKHKYDLIHSWHWSSDWSEALAARLAGIPWVYTKKAMSWGSPRNWMLRTRLATFVTTINPDMKPLYFPDFEKIRMLPLGLDTDYYYYQEKTYSHQDLHFAKEDFIVISVVNLIRSKGIEVLVDAVHHLSNPSIKVLIVGDYSSEYGQWVYQKVIKEGLTSRVFFTGKVLDVRPYLALSDIFVTPTNVNWEGMPMAPVEAMSCGRVVVGTNTSGINYILKDFSEFLVPPNDPIALANRIKELKFLSESKRAELGRQMREKIISQFSVQHFAMNYGSLYLEILNAKS